MQVVASRIWRTCKGLFLQSVVRERTERLSLRALDSNRVLKVETASTIEMPKLRAPC